MARTEPVRMRAYAKVNLALSLGAPEPAGAARAGWHRISTWMHAIDLADEVLVQAMPGAVSTWSACWAGDALRAGLVDWPVEKDLAWRGLRALEAHVGEELPTRMALTKRIPTGGGLGGGSSDAGVALVALNAAWGLGLSAETLAGIGAKLGSDVPFFVDGVDGVDGGGADGEGVVGVPPRPAVVGGFGDEIERTGRASGALVLMVPAFGCPTPGVYRAFDRGIGEGHALDAARVEGMARAGRVVDGELFNDLAGPACVVRPALAALRDRAAGCLGRTVHVTGSGSAMFALVDEGEGARVVERLGRDVPGVVSVVTRLV